MSRAWLLILVMLGSWGGSASLAFASEMPFLTGTIERQPVIQERIVDGRVQAVQQSTISSQTSGRVVAVNFDVDDFVEQGDVVIRLSDNEQQARLRLAEGNLSEARAGAEQANAEYVRIQSVFEQQLVSRSEYDRARAARDSARARLQSAQAGVAEAREQLGYSQVIAPFPGIVTERHVEVGETVSPGTPLVSGISLDRMRVEINVPQQVIPSLRRHREAAIIVGQDQRIVAESLTFFPYADPSTNTFRVRLNLPEALGGVELFPGMFVKTAIKLGEEPRLVVPSEAVVFRSEVVAVYVVNAEGRLSMRQIRLGRELPEGFEILAGLSEGERVALDPIHAGIHLKENQQVAQ